MNVKPRKNLKVDWTWLRACVDFTPQEKIFVASVIVVALIGLTARWWMVSHANSHRPVPADPEYLEEAHP